MSAVDRVPQARPSDNERLVERPSEDGLELRRWRIALIPDPRDRRVARARLLEYRLLRRRRRSDEFTTLELVRHAPRLGFDPALLPPSVLTECRRPGDRFEQIIVESSDV